MELKVGRYGTMVDNVSKPNGNFSVTCWMDLEAGVQEASTAAYSARTS